MDRRSPIAAALVLALAAAAPAADPKDEEAVARAIKGGQAYLKAYFNPVRGPGGFGPVPGAGDVGAMMGLGNGGGALAGLALVESGLPANDPVVALLARSVREQAVAVEGTYPVSLYIMFLDRLGSKDDEPLIQFLTLRLLTGQCADGSWSYQCAGLALDPVEQRALYADLYRGVKVVTPDALPKPKKKEARPREDLDDNPKPGKKDEPPPPKEEEKPRGLHPALEKYERRIREMTPGSGAGFGLGPTASGDHSNTQFATVGLWCGRRHSVDVTAALSALDKHYRQCQGEDGGWGYTASPGSSSPAMSCAGLMGLAMGFAKDARGGLDRAVRLDADAIAKDRALERGLKYVGDFLAAAGGQRDPRSGMFQPNDLSGNLYFMWSLERVGMVYGLTTIGKVDWYDWGSKVLVRTQNRDGSWSTNSNGSVDNATAFALLFLSRANLAEDLASSMKGKVKDPGTSRLRSPADLNEMLGKAGKGSTGTKPEAGTARPKDPAAKADPPAAAPSAGKLADDLVAADGPERDALVARYRDTKGVEYTDALARAIPKLTGEAKAQARDALARRAGRFTPATLNAMMAERDPELRRAAALAAGGKGRDRLADLADALVRLTADDDAQVAQAARASLKALSGEDFGPEPGASAADRTRALTAWQNWWAKQKSK